MISIVTPIYDTYPVCRMCIEAVRDNTSYPYEHILVNNHPPYPETEQYIQLIQDTPEDYPFVRVLDFGENVGCHEAVNRGFEVAQGNYLCKLDNDTIVPPGWAGLFLLAFEKVPNLFALSSDLDKDRQPWEKEIITINGIKLEILPKNMVTFSCIMWTREAWEKIKPLRSAHNLKYYGGAEDYLYYRSKELGLLIAHYPAVVCQHLARTEYTDERYGEWKLKYCAGEINVDFKTWVEQGMPKD